MNQPIQHPITEGPWEAYSFQNGAGQMTVVSFNSQDALASSTNPVLTTARVIVHLPINTVDHNGLPQEVAFDRLRRIEKHLIGALEESAVECRLVGRRNWEGKQEFVFHTANLDAFTTALRPMLEKDSAYRMELQSAAGGDYFEKNIKPSPQNWQRIQDRKTMGDLLGAGADPAEPHQLRFTFTGEPDQLTQIEDMLREKGFTQLEEEPGRVVMAKESLLYPDLVFSLSAEMFNLSVAVGARYAGWQARPLG